MMAAIYQNPATILTIVGLMLAFTVASTWIFRAHKVSADYYLPGRRGSHLVNASAISSDYLSAASFLGVAGIAFLEGFDGMVYALGFFVGYLTLLILLAGPLRKFGRYTVPDFVSVRFHSKAARLLGVAGVLSISLFYMAPQMLAAGKILGLVLGLDYRTAIAVVALAITLYVSVGGMKGTTVSQVVQFWILFGSMFLLAFIPWVLHGLTYGQVVTSIAAFDAGGGAGAFDGSAFVAPGFALTGPVEALSLLLALMCGTAGLPHILERYFTASDGVRARRTMLGVLFLIGFFYILSPYVGHVVRLLSLQWGEAGLTPAMTDWLAANGKNLAVPVAGAFFGGQVLLGVVVAGAFAAILSTMAGLIIACAGTVGHDLAVNVFDPQMPEGRRVSIARAAAVAIGLLGIPLGLVAEDMQIAVLVGLAFAVAASTFFPVLVLGVWWPKMTCGGAIAGLATGLVGSLTTILGRVFLPEWLQFRNPGGLVMFLAFGAILLFSWLERTARGESAVPNDTEEVMIRMHGPEAG